ncbi:unnamed protein product [Amoebophrya sp. A25]|nr:unnamed protein product [Amoebophrya sp. A25]|eukprot:GSA25T00007444001.1
MRNTLPLSDHGIDSARVEAALQKANDRLGAIRANEQVYEGGMALARVSKLSDYIKKVEEEETILFNGIIGQRQTGVALAHTTSKETVDKMNEILISVKQQQGLDENGVVELLSEAKSQLEKMKEEVKTESDRVFDENDEVEVLRQVLDNDRDLKVQAKALAELYFQCVSESKKLADDAEEELLRQISRAAASRRDIEPHPEVVA